MHGDTKQLKRKTKRHVLHIGGVLHLLSVFFFFCLLLLLLLLLLFLLCVYGVCARARARARVCVCVCVCEFCVYLFIAVVVVVCPVLPLFQVQKTVKFQTVLVPMNSRTLHSSIKRTTRQASVTHKYNITCPCFMTLSSAVCVWSITKQKLKRE